jgi:peroxiredoxin
MSTVTMRRSFRPLTLFLLLVLTLILVPAAGWAQTPANELPAADDPSGARTGVPDYNLMTLKGSEMRLSSLRGRVVLLDFFLAACPHCKAHARFVSDLAKRYRDRGLVVLNLCTNNPYVDRETVQQYAQEAGIDNDILFVSFELLSLYLTPQPDGTYGVPQAVLFNADGRVAARFTKWQEQDKPEIEQTIVKLLKK